VEFSFHNSPEGNEMHKSSLALFDSAQLAKNIFALEAMEARQLLSAAFIEAGGRLVVRGTSGNDQITISRDPSNTADIKVVLNGASMDFASKFVTQVRVEAGAGNDLVQADASKGAIAQGMFFLGEAGNDTLFTSTANDALLGGGDSDVLIAKAGNNYVNGGDGSDKLFAGTGNDTLIGEGGTDHFSDAGGKNTFADLAKGEVSVKAAVPATVAAAIGAPSTPAKTPTPAPVASPAPAPLPAQSTSASPFVIGVWSQPAWSMDKWKSRGINTMVGYESLSGTVSVESYSAAAVADGLYMIRQPNADPSKDVNQKNLLAWMLNDEPDYHNTPAATLVSQYQAMKKADPKIPVFTNFSGSSALWGYGGEFEADYKKWLAATDWVSNDLYPVTAHDRPSALDAPGLAVQQLANWSGGKRQFAVIEASDQQLPGHEDYPGVTADQFRAEVFNAVISGATGIIYFPQRIGDGFLFDNMTPQVTTEMTSVDARLARIGPALMSAKDPGGMSVDVSGNLRVTWRKYGGKTYMIVLNNSATGAAAKIDVHGVSGTTASVDGEGRSVAIKSGVISDSFKPYEAHVYVVG
jgi:hypothetical protein